MATINQNYDDDTTLKEFYQIEKSNEKAINDDLVIEKNTNVSHRENKSNPHSVTKSQIGLSNVDNVKQATKTELDALIKKSTGTNSIILNDVSGNSVSGANSTAMGKGIISTAECQLAIGKYNVDDTTAMMVIGNGSLPPASTIPARINIFRVSNSGGVYAMEAYNSTGADYAEMFEWADGNPNNEDRRGLFVTLDGDKIRLANANDSYILGIVSANPGVVGNNYGDQWVGMYETNLWGDVVIDDEGQPVINPDYDSTQAYVPREMRHEWGCIGMMGQLIVIDDGSCVVNGYCGVGQCGKATASEHGYRVMKRIDDTHILVLFK